MAVLVNDLSFYTLPRTLPNHPSDVLEQPRTHSGP